jgi:hypothetical protein
MIKYVHFSRWIATKTVLLLYLKQKFWDLYFEPRINYLYDEQTVSFSRIAEDRYDFHKTTGNTKFVTKIQTIQPLTEISTTNVGFEVFTAAVQSVNKS